MKLNSFIRSLIAVTMVSLFITACGPKPGEQVKDSTNQGVNNAGGNNNSTGNQTEENSGQPKSWSSPPDMKIDINKTYTAVMETSKGSFTIELFAKDAPQTVNNFVFLAKEGFYDRVKFHRIMQSFMIQTGDPLGTGRGGPGYSIIDELPTKYKYDVGIVAMANSGSNSGGSQFFICTGDDCARSLNHRPDWAIFGKVISGLDIVESIAATSVEADARGEMSKPTEIVTIKSINIEAK